MRQQPGQLSGQAPLQQVQAVVLRGDGQVQLAVGTEPGLEAHDLAPLGPIRPRTAHQPLVDECIDTGNPLGTGVQLGEDALPRAEVHHAVDNGVSALVPALAEPGGEVGMARLHPQPPVAEQHLAALAVAGADGARILGDGEIGADAVADGIGLRRLHPPGHGAAQEMKQEGDVVAQPLALEQLDDTVLGRETMADAQDQASVGFLQPLLHLGAPACQPVLHRQWRRCGGVDHHRAIERRQPDALRKGLVEPQHALQEGMHAGEDGRQLLHMHGQDPQPVVGMGVEPEIQVEHPLHDCLLFAGQDQIPHALIVAVAVLPQQGLHRQAAGRLWHIADAVQQPERAVAGR